jgi:hypothetical protein
VGLHTIVDSRERPPNGRHGPVLHVPARLAWSLAAGAQERELAELRSANYRILMPQDMDLVALWREVLGENSNPSLSFTSNGGDSFQAVLISVHVSELWHVDIDYLDVLKTPNAMAFADLVKHAPPAT